MIPHDSSVLIPRLVCRDPAAEIGFCVATFGATEVNVRAGPDGKVAHALLTIGPAMLMIEREWAVLASRAPETNGSSAVVLYLYVEDVDETVERAVAGGAQLLVEPTDQFWGDRTAWIMDPAGHVWTVATRIEEPTESERGERWAKEMDRAR
jgi:PhnB protein